MCINMLCVFLLIIAKLNGMCFIFSLCRLSVGASVAARDIVQFVPFRDFKFVSEFS